MKREKETNFIRAIYDECYFDKRYSDPDSIALAYLMTKSSELGISADFKDVRIKKTLKTTSGKYVYFEQHVNNIPVFSASGIVVINRGDTVINMLNNFRKINGNPELNTEPDISAEDAIKLLPIILILRKE